MLTRALLTGIYDSQMQYVEYTIHCRRILVCILLNILNLNKSRMGVKKEKLRTKTVTDFAAHKGTGENDVTLKKKKKLCIFCGFVIVQVQNEFGIRSLDLISMWL